MVRWQYAIVNIGIAFPGERFGVCLSYFGQRGWELAFFADKYQQWDGFMLFKRPVQHGEEPDGPWSELWTFPQVSEAYQALKDSNG